MVGKQLLSAGLARLRRLSLLFYVLVVIPTGLAILYYGFIASDIYISESRFTLRQPEKRTTSSLGQFLQSAGITSSHDDLYTIKDYILSRDVLAVIDNNLGLRKKFSSPSIDFLDRFGIIGNNTFEDFFLYYKDRVSIEIDTNSSICILQVKAYSPTLAHDMNEALLFLGEGFVNAINERARQDLIQFASNDVKEAEGEAKAAALTLSRYRNRQTLFDPKQESTIQLQQVSQLQRLLIEARSHLAQIRISAPDSPYIKVLELRVENLKREINAETGKVTGGKESIVGKMTEYERLTLERDFTDKRLSATLASLEEAKSQANRQQLYLGRIVQPNIPDQAFYPKRVRNIALIFFGGLLAYGVLRLLQIGVEEHRD